MTQSELACGLRGTIDRWAAAPNYYQQAQTIYQKITQTEPRIAQFVNAKLQELHTTAVHATPEQWREALNYANTQCFTSQQRESAAFGLRELRHYFVIPHFDLVFIGGGPIGLWTAALVKTMNAALSVLVLEKRVNYIRNHVLRVEQESFDAYPGGISPRLDDFVNHLRTNQIIPVQQIETSLSELNLSAGTKIEFVKVDNPEELVQYFPTTRVFIGSDGARSLIRNEVFQDHPRLEKQLQRFVQITYQIHKSATLNFHLNPQSFHLGFNTISKMHMTLVDERTKQRNDRADKTLTFSASAEIFNKITGASFANPFNLTTQSLPDEISHDFLLWTGMKEHVYGEVRILASEKITSIDGTVRISQNFVKSYQGKHWCTLGDAAASFPLERGFNMGIKGGIQLANSIIGFFNAPNAELVTGNGIDGRVPRPFKAYADFGATIEDQELCFLGCPLDQKNRFIDLWKVITVAGRVLPRITALDQVTEEIYINAGRNPGHTPMGHIAATKSLSEQSIDDYNNRQPSGIPQAGQNLSTLDRIQQSLAAYRNNVT